MKTAIINVGQDMAEETSELAMHIFIDHFQNIICLDQARYMAELFLSAKAINEELAMGTIFKLISVDGQNAGFTEYKIDGDRIFLSKLYVDKNYRGQGLAHALLEEVLNYGKKAKKRAVYLTVNKYNDKTIEIYKHWNFQVIDAVETPIGNGYIMDDYIMEKAL